MSLELKYFVLKPRGESPFAQASRLAIKAYAESIQSTDEKLAGDLMVWVRNCWRGRESG